MSSSPPTFDPYAVLGVGKDATLAEIKAAHRRLVLKCHPDKVKDESQREAAQDEFQRVQQAYELLSDETQRARYDQKARLAELRKEAMEKNGGAGASPYSPKGSGSSSTREYRDGRVYEERVPADAGSFEDDEPVMEEAQPSSRKHDDGGKRQRSKATSTEKTSSEKKKSKSIFDNFRAAARDSSKSAHSDRTSSDRAKHRTKDRKRESSDKHERAAPYPETEHELSDSDASYHIKRSTEPKKPHDTSSRRTKSDSSRRTESTRYHDDDYSDGWESKHEYLHTTARDYILRSRGSAPVEIDRRAHVSHSPSHSREYIERVEPEVPRRSGRSRSSRPSSSGREGRSSYEHLDSHSPPMSYHHKVPSMPTATSAPSGIKIPPKPPQPTRASTMPYVRSKRDTLGRSEPALFNIVPGPVDSAPPRPSKFRTPERHDSGYSSPGTPEMHQSGSPPKSSTSTRYKIVDEPETILIEPELPSHRHQRSSSPVRQERQSIPIRPAAKLTRTSTTYAFPAEPLGRHDPAHPPAARKSPTRPLFGEVEYARGIKEKDIRYAREIRPNDVIYTHDVYPAMGRRQSAYA